MPWDGENKMQVFEEAAVKAAELIKREEAFRPHAYPDAGYKWQVPTIGYGTARVYPSTGQPVRRGDTITEERAFNELLMTMVQGLETINQTVETPLNENQTAALLSFIYNVGPKNFENSSLLKKINEGDMQGAASIFSKYNLSNGQKLASLTKRRANEAALFNTPSTMVTPTVDVPLAEDIPVVDAPVLDAPVITNPEMQATPEVVSTETPARQPQETPSMGTLMTQDDGSQLIPGVAEKLRGLGRSLGLTK